MWVQLHRHCAVGSRMHHDLCEIISGGHVVSVLALTYSTVGKGLALN